MTLSPGAKVHPKRSTLRSPAGFNAACNSMLSERAPTPPRFIGQSTWISPIGFKPKRLRMRVFTNCLGIFGRDEVESALAADADRTRDEIRHAPAPALAVADR